MKSLFIKVILLFVFFASSPLLAADESSPCGMEQSPETGGYIVSFADGDICEEDLVFQALYLLFEDTFQDPWSRTLVTFFVDDNVLDSEFTAFADSTINVSDVIHYILSATAILGWSIMTPLLAYKSYRLALTLKRTGRVDFEESQGDVIKFSLFVSFLILMSLPVGFSSGKGGDKPPLMLGQVLAIVAALPANMGGNYFYSSYLSATELASKDVPINEDLLLPVGQGISNAMVEGSLCELTTRQSLININAKASTSFFSSSTVGDFFDYDHESVAKRFDYCLAYSGDVKEGGLARTIDTFSLNKSVLNSEPECSVFQKGYDADTFGHAHSCMRIKYNFGEDKFANLEDVLEEGDLDDQLDSLREAFKASDFYARFKIDVKAKINEIMDNSSLSSVEKYAEVDKVVIEAAESVFSSSLAGSSILHSGSNEAKQVRHLAVAGFLLGGSIDESSWDSFWGAAGLERSSIWTHTNHYPSLTHDDEMIFGIENILKDAKETAELIVGYKCVSKWVDTSGDRQFILDYNKAEGKDEIESLFANKSANLECVKFLSEDEEGSSDTDRYVRYVVDDPYVFGDKIKDPSTGQWVSQSPGDTTIESSLTHMEEVLLPKLKKEIQVNQFVISGYTAAVKKAITDSLITSLSTIDAEEQRDMALRPRGWGVFGGALLYTGQTQASSMHMAKSLDNVISVSVLSTGDDYIAKEAYKNLSEDTDKTLSELFTDYPADELFTIGPDGARSYTPNSGFTAEVDDGALMQYFMTKVESLILSPMDHIKETSGMPQNKSLSYGLQECFDGGYDNCLSGTKHPIVAFSNFGNEMINNMITLMVTTELVMYANNLELSESDGSASVDGDKKKKGFFSKASEKIKKVFEGLKNLIGGVVMALIKIVLGMIQVAAVILSFLKPLFVTLLVMGIVFAYIIPMMSFLFGFMMMCLFIVNVFVIAVVMPLYLFSKWMTVEKDYMNGFKLFIQDMLGTYLTPAFFAISATLSWSMIVVILYAINISFSLIYHGLGATSESSSFNIFSTLIFNLLIYVIYFLSVFVLFRFGLGLMKSMPDQMKEKLNLKKGDDDNYINSLGFEQYVKGSIMKQLAEMPSELVGAIAKHSQNGGYKNMKSLRDEVKRAEEVADRLGINMDNARGRGAEDAMELDRREKERTQQPSFMDDIPPMGSYNSSGDDTSYKQDEQTSPQSEPAKVDSDESLNKRDVDEKGKPKVKFTEGDATDSSAFDEKDGKDKNKE